MLKEGFYNNKPVIFYVGLAFSGVAALWSFIVSIVYGACYNHSAYYNGWGVALPLVGMILFVAALIVQLFLNKLPYISNVGAVALWLLSFIGFIVFINASYLYFSEVFFGGFSMAALSNMEPSYLFCLIIFVIIVIFSNIGMFMISVKSNKQPAQLTEGAEV